MSSIPVTKKELERPWDTRSIIEVDMSFMLDNSTPNPLFEEMHKTIYTFVNTIFALAIIFIIIIRLLIKDIHSLDIIGEMSAYYCLLYFCIQTYICSNIILEEQCRDIGSNQKMSEANRIYLVLSGCAGSVSMLIYLLSCQISGRFFYHFAGIFLCISILLTIVSFKKNKARRNYNIFVCLGIIYTFALLLILK